LIFNCKILFYFSIKLMKIIIVIKNPRLYNLYDIRI